jgi:predicted Holliday junction resolvase-like endonuclease
LVSKIHERGEIDEESYQESGTLIRGRVDENLAHQLKDFLL